MAKGTWPEASREFCGLLGLRDPKTRRSEDRDFGIGTRAGRVAEILRAVWEPQEAPSFEMSRANVGMSIGPASQRRSREGRGCLAPQRECRGVAVRRFDPVRVEAIATAFVVTAEVPRISSAAIYSGPQGRLKFRALCPFGYTSFEF